MEQVSSVLAGMGDIVLKNTLQDIGGVFVLIWKKKINNF